ncbi:MAG: hypothetical protein QF722_07150, partial [Candidatus Thalassarchaeaceae archaeon]|nr:hypothetical protein [Candidatus Thalassarchaeaceae archaeon]
PFGDGIAEVVRPQDGSSMQDDERREMTGNGWPSSTAGGRFATPFSEEELGVPFGLPSRLSRLENMPWHGCYEMQLASEKKSKHTLRSYRTASKQFLMTVIPGELPPSWDALQWSIGFVGPIHFRSRTFDH